MSECFISLLQLDGCPVGESVQVVLVMEDVALVSLIPTASVMFIREEGLASLQLGQMGGMDVDTGNSDLFDIHRIGHPGNFLDDLGKYTLSHCVNFLHELIKQIWFQN